jgi:hypothetical protein
MVSSFKYHTYKVISFFLVENIVTIQSVDPNDQNLVKVAYEEKLSATGDKIIKHEYDSIKKTLILTFETKTIAQRVGNFAEVKIEKSFRAIFRQIYLKRENDETEPNSKRN